MRPPQRTYKKMPVELWLLVFAHLQKKDLVNLASTCKHIGAIAEATFYRTMGVRSSLVITATTALSARHRADAVRSLTVSLDGVVGYAKCAGVVLRLAGALSQLPSLRELAIIGAKLPEAAVRDVLADCPSKQLEKFHCDSDALVLASWSSLANQCNLEEFRGVFDHVHAPPPHVTPAAFPKLRVLDAGAHFVSRIGRKSGVTHLSARVSRATAPNVLSRVTEDLGEQLVALRVVRTFRSPPRGDPFWGSDSPVVLCSALKAPVLKFFELRDVAPVNEVRNKIPYYSSRTDDRLAGLLLGVECCPRGPPRATRVRTQFPRRPGGAHTGAMDRALEADVGRVGAVGEDGGARLCSGRDGIAT